MKERIIIEFDNWDYGRSIEQIENIKEAIDAGDFTTVAEYLKVHDADDIRIEREVTQWEVVR